MDLKLIFSILWTILVLGVYIHYIHSILKWKTKPHSYTWLIFAIILFLSFTIQTNHSWGFGSYILLFEAIWCSTIFLFSLKYGEKEITRSDTLFLIMAFISILLWIIFDLPVWSTILIICIDFFALLPTFRKSYKKPYEETTIMYFIWGFIFLLSLLAIDDYNFLTTWYQIAVIIFDWGLVLFLLQRRRMLSKK